jgi:hypothetical protein
MLVKAKSMAVALRRSSPRDFLVKSLRLSNSVKNRGGRLQDTVTVTTHPEVPGCFSSIIDIPPAVISSKEISQSKGRRAAGKTFWSSKHLARTTRISMVKSKARYDIPFPVGLPSLCRLERSSP